MQLGLNCASESAEATSRCLGFPWVAYRRTKEAPIGAPSHLTAWADDLLAVQKIAAETLTWVPGTNGSRSLVAQIHASDGETTFVLSARVNRVGEWSILLTVEGNIQLLRYCSHHKPHGYHGVKHPTWSPSPPHEADLELADLTAEQALQHFCRRANIQFTAEQMFFGGTYD